MQKFSSKVIMDASASPKANADINDVYGLLLNAIEKNNFPRPVNQRSTIIKYTKLPEFEIESKVSWPPIFSLPARVRRIVTLDDVEVRTNRSLKPDFPHSMNIMASKYTKRKIVTIAEDDENDLHPKFSKEKRASPKTSNRSVGNDIKEEKQMTHRSTSRLITSSKYSKDTKAGSKTNNATKKEVNVTKQNYRSKPTNNPPVEKSKTRYVKDKEIGKHPKPTSISSRSSISRNLPTPSESEKELSIIKNKLYANAKPIEPFKKAENMKLVHALPQNKTKKSYFKELQSKNQAVTVIHVPLDNKYRRHCATESKMSINSLQDSVEELNFIDRGTDTRIVELKDVKIGTDPLPNTNDQNTNMDDFANFICTDSTVQTMSINDTFDSLEIPNVTLTKDKTERKENAVNNSSSVQNLKVPPPRITPRKEELDSGDISFCENASYIIGRATLTYTTKQKINFHVVGSTAAIPNRPPSPLTYPMNIVSVFKNELNKQTKAITAPDESDEKKNMSSKNYTNSLNELKSLNCSYIFNSNKLMKPSDIISTIRVNNGLLPNDYVCEQFQRELNFIDSFFESLQYLESSSLSEKCFADDKVENFVHNSALFDSGFEVKNSEYDNFLSKIENGASIEDTETIASKSLCLLNLLIRDEQRRAKNLLFVLKMREDALKDFTKSQILWLEKKKKLENTDISTLKKKQRGALLKLQHECGEMQRMRKALLTLSEKRKVSLMKTKKNIELKLKTNVDVEQIIFGKKKLKRSTPSEQRNTAPLKCFDLSSSGCEDSITSRPNSEVALLPPEAPTALITSIKCAEKSIQTGDSIQGSILMDQSTDTAADNFVTVDGGYLNILFHNLTLPEIFSNGKQYEVNEEALKNIVNTSNNQNHNLNGCDIVDKLMEQIKKRDVDRSSSPSTAHSLVDEFDQYYKGLVEEEKTPIDKSHTSPDKVDDIKDVNLHALDLSLQSDECNQSISTMTSGSGGEISNNDLSTTTRSRGCDPLVHMEGQCQTEKELVMTSCQTTGPLPVPVGAAASPESLTPYTPVWVPSKSSDSTSTSESISSQPLYASVSSLSLLASPVQCEAEELRRQQLAIEREIKALEQQQCRLLVVREIPDKPPPPYTPPAEPRSKLPRLFKPDHTTEDKIQKHMNNNKFASFDPTDPFDAFLKDFCHETIERHKQELSEYPWDACNLLPQKQQVDNQQLTETTSIELNEILTGAAPTVVSGISSRRSDHIDDILFAEWRRCEPAWTTLHTDEAIVKNQLFESIFQKILSETIDEYRRTVQCNTLVD